MTRRNDRYLDSPSGDDAESAKQAIKQFSCPSNSRIPVKERVVRLGQQCTLDNKAVATDAEAQVTGTLGAVSARNVSTEKCDSSVGRKICWMVVVVVLVVVVLLLNPTI